MARKCKTRKHLTKHHTTKKHSKTRKHSKKHDDKGKKHLHVKVEVKHKY